MSEGWISLTLAERGLLESVIRALLLYGPMKDDPRAVAQRTMALPEDYAFIEQAWPKIREFLLPNEDGRLSDPEVDAAKAESAAYMTQRRENGKLGGRPKKKTSGFDSENQVVSSEKPGGFDSENQRFQKQNHSTEHDRTYSPLPPAGGTRRGEPPASEANALDEAFHRFFKLYPKQEREDAACRQWVSLVGQGIITEALLPKIMAGLAAYKNSKAWEKEGGQYIPRADKFLQERMWKDAPEPSETAKIAQAAKQPWTGTNPYQEFPDDLLKPNAKAVQERQVAAQRRPYGAKVTINGNTYRV
jgi:hypothetical protein